MKRKPPAWLILWLITMSAAFLLGATNEMTAEMIQQRSLEEKEAARNAVFSEADSFSVVTLEHGDEQGIDECYAAMKDSSIIGYVCTVNEQGYGGPIEVISGIKTDGEITGITVGGSKFAETAGLGANTKQPAFITQFSGKKTPLTLKMDIDAVTGASISSGAVVKAVNEAAEFVRLLGGEAQ